MDVLLTIVKEVPVAALIGVLLGFLSLVLLPCVANIVKYLFGFILSLIALLRNFEEVDYFGLELRKERRLKSEDSPERQDSNPPKKDEEKIISFYDKQSKTNQRK